MLPAGLVSRANLPNLDNVVTVILADFLVSQVGESLHKEPSSELQETLYYL